MQDFTGQPEDEILISQTRAEQAPAMTACHCFPSFSSSYPSAQDSQLRALLKSHFLSPLDML